MTSRTSIVILMADDDADDRLVVLTTSQTEEDIYCGYDLGANSYITKPVTFEALVNVMNALGTYWFEVVNLPQEAPSA